MLYSSLYPYMEFQMIGLQHLSPLLELAEKTSIQSGMTT